MLIIAILLIAFQAKLINSQELPADTVTTINIPSDTVTTIIPRADTVAATVSAPADIKDEIVHSPQKAAMYSAILPGLGQAYNKKYWKIPLVYGGFAAFGYFINFNNNRYKLFKLYYSDLTDGNDMTNSFLDYKYVDGDKMDDLSYVETLKRGFIREQDRWRRWRDMNIIMIVGFYGLNIIDASVDAHFFNWDISDDLTLRWQPTIDQLYNKNIFALNCTIRF